MGMELTALVEEVRRASSSLEAGDTKTNKRIDELAQSINELFRKAGRPGTMITADDEISERKSAIGLCHTRRNLTTPKIDAGVSDDWTPSSSEIDQALTARRAMKALFRHGDTSRLDALEQKSLSSFSYGNNGFLLAPEMSSQVLSCLVDPTDISGLVNRVAISSGSVRFLIDNVRMRIAGWACDASCFANNPQPDLAAGLGTLEVKAEPLRFVVCATSDLLADASFDVETWLMEKVSRGFRDAINNAIVVGDGIGKPMGLLHPASGIPIVETGAATEPGQFSWQDLVQLKFEIPQQWHNGASFLGRVLINPV